jgi:hypothetical protein
MDADTLRLLIPDPIIAAVALAAAVPIAVAGLVVWLERRDENRAEKTFLAEKMLRSAGYLLRLELDAIFRKTVLVEPLVILPGWFVETRQAPLAPAARPARTPRRPSQTRQPSRPDPFKTKVLNTLALPEHLRRQPRKLKPAQLRQLLQALDEKCRDVEI